MAYATDADILSAVNQFRRPDHPLTSVSAIIHKAATAEVNKSLGLLGISSTDIVDIDNLLDIAETCFALELYSESRQMETIFGAVRTERAGKITKQYDSSMPMFFFAQGSDIQFLPLLPHETWRMRGYLCCQAWITLSYSTRHTNSPYGVSAHDNTGRGYGYDNDDYEVLYDH